MFKLIVSAANRASLNRGTVFCKRLVSGFGTESQSNVFPNEGDNSNEPHIPAYEQRPGELVETMRARLLYQSRKRGMLENGLLLSTFAAQFLDSMNEHDLKEYDRLINCPSNDWDIYYWATGIKPIPAEFDTPTMQKFIAHVQNKNRESRLQQPNLKESK